MTSPSSRATELLQALADGDTPAREELLRLVYDELRSMSRQQLARERPGQTLQATDLVHEVYLRLLGSGEQRFENRRHFFGAAAEAMRRILIERARRKARLRHGGQHRRVDAEDARLDEAPIEKALSTEELFALEEVLGGLEELDRDMALVVKLRYHVGMSVEETAEALGTSTRTVKRQWAAARVWLRRELDRRSVASPPSGDEAR